MATSLLRFRRKSFALFSRRISTVTSFVNGRYIDVREGSDAFPTYNPATGEVIAMVQTANEADIAEAVTAAKHGFEQWFASFLNYPFLIVLCN